MAKSDTPEEVKIPESLTGLAIWAVGKFGIGIVFLGMVYFVYMDQSRLVERMMGAFERRAEVDTKIAQALTENAHVLTALKDEIRGAHDRAAGKINVIPK